MEDVTPKLLEQIEKDFKKLFDENEIVSRFYKKARNGTARYKDAHEFAIEISEILTKAYLKNLSSSNLPDGKMYYNIADRIITRTLKKNYNLACEAARKVQESINEEQGIGIKAIRPALNDDRIKGIVDIVSGKDKFDDISYMLKEPITNFTQSVIDDTVRENADFQYRSGLDPVIVRTSTGKCCKWCDRLAGIYEYSKVSDTGNNVFRRHKGCKCIVEFEKAGRRQNVHTKQWKMIDESDRIKARKEIENTREIKQETPAEKEKRINSENQLGLVERIVSHPKMLQAYTPEGLKEALENKGYIVKTLGRGKYKGIRFEDGGGFRVNFGGDGILQYHPEKGSHHGGAYYKTSTGKGGIKHYELNGEEIDFGKTRKTGKQVTK